MGDALSDAAAGEFAAYDVGRGGSDCDARFSVMSTHLETTRDSLSLIKSLSMSMPADAPGSVGGVWVSETSRVKLGGPSRTVVDKNLRHE